VASPVYDVIERAAKELPVLQGMRVDQIASEVFELAKIQARMTQDPVPVLMEVAKQYGALDGLKALLSGQAPDQASQGNVDMANTIRRLERELAEVRNPQYVSNLVQEQLTHRSVESEINAFASASEHWGALEAVMPQFIEVAQTNLPAGSSAKDTLAKAYQMAVTAYGLQASQDSSTPKADPKKTEAAIKAKSVNVSSRSTGQPSQMSDEDMMRAAYRRAKAS
jgi:hypothetical protein